MRSLRIAGISPIGRDVAGNACFPRKGYIITDGNMTGATRLAGKNYMITAFGTACNPHLSNEEAIFANFNIMTQVYQIVNLRTATH